MDTLRYKIKINGIVQGVGFRPFVFRLAHENNLTGFVNNSKDGVVVEIEGSSENITNFQTKLFSQTPSQASILDLSKKQMPPQGDKKFIIKKSSTHEKPDVFISPDIAICDDCLSDTFDPKNRRYLYPFTNCTNCGPRYTILTQSPYDRPNTSMQPFQLCKKCLEEYNNPYDRRFHAQPNACSKCGPTLYLKTDNKIISKDVIKKTSELLLKGKIGAIQGIGGFHLAVDAKNDKAVSDLRKRKGRSHKPFALMAKNIEIICKYCNPSETEIKLLKNPIHPICLLHKKNSQGISDAIAPRNNYLGFMLPYTPLHYLLFEYGCEILVMTSGNYSEEPIAITVDDVEKRLNTIYDFILYHDRKIYQRCDDSIVKLLNNNPVVIRRSRGFVPHPVQLKDNMVTEILACGAELKNTFALSRQNFVFFSQHIGNLDNPVTFDFYDQSISHLSRLLDIKPQIIAHDLHPEYLSTKWAHKQKNIRKIGIQHHHAHFASVLAEHNITEPVIGLILDGTGYGLDGSIWGGEIFIGNLKKMDRIAWLEPVLMPGGTQAVQEPWRMAVSYLYHTFGNDLKKLDIPFLKTSTNNIDFILQLLDKKINCPATSSCGRLFDAVSSILGICHINTFEAQAAIELEMACEMNDENRYINIFNDTPVSGQLSVKPLIKAIVNDIQEKTKTSKIAVKFHLSLADLFIQTIQTISKQTKINKVALSGGVFQNKIFFTYLANKLKKSHIIVYSNQIIPANDGGIALGQLALANAILKSEQVPR